MRVQGEPAGAEYGRPGHVEKEVAEAIANFVNGKKPESPNEPPRR